MAITEEIVVKIVKKVENREGKNRRRLNV